MQRPTLQDEATMKPAVNNAVWFFSGMLLLAALVFVVLRNQESASQQVVDKTKRIEVVTRMRAGLAAASEAEKSAVLATTDQDSQTYADQARERATAVERDRVELERLLQKSGSNEEKVSLAEFSKSFIALQEVDAQVLELAVKNTNLKAWAMAFGPAAETMKDFDGALSRLIAQSANSSAPNAKKVMLLASGAQAAAFRINVLVPPHIAEETDPKMDQFEAAMSKEDDVVRKDLKDLAALLPSSDEVTKANASYTKFGDLRRQILKLSRENTNVRSLSMSLNQKRKLMLLCESALASLEQMIKAEPIAGVPSPR
jgi:hypothetical protein